MFVAENPCLVRVLVIAVFSVSERLTFAKKKGEGRDWG